MARHLCKFLSPSRRLRRLGYGLLLCCSFYAFHSYLSVQHVGQVQRNDAQTRNHTGNSSEARVFEKQRLEQENLEDQHQQQQQQPQQQQQQLQQQQHHQQGQSQQLQQQQEQRNQQQPLQEEQNHYHHQKQQQQQPPTQQPAVSSINETVITTHNETDSESKKAHRHNDRTVQDFVLKYRVDFSSTFPAGETPWHITNKWATFSELLPDNAPELGAVLNFMANAPIVQADDPGKWKGSQFKLLLTLPGGQRVIFKPKWHPRDMLWTHTFCNMHDLHTAEITAFHLSRVLGFRRTPLAVGRVLRVSKDILPVGTKSLLETVYHVNETNSTCIYGHCYLCNKEKKDWVEHYCTRDDHIEGAMILWMPEHLKPRELYFDTHPWLRPCYEKDLVKQVLKNKSHCDSILKSRSQPPVYPKHWYFLNPFFNNSALFLDLIDASIFQYIINNADRKVSVAQSNDSRQSLLAMMDNGKSFQHPARDEPLILAPLFQCCMVRKATYDRLLLLENGRLSAIMRSILEPEPLSPILTEPHLQAMDRRLAHAIRVIHECVKREGPEHVFR